MYFTVLTVIMLFTRFPRFHPPKHVMLEQTAQAKEEESSLFLELWVDFCVCFGYSYWIFWAEKNVFCNQKGMFSKSGKSALTWNTKPCCSDMLELELLREAMRAGNCCSAYWYKSRIAFTWSQPFPFLPDPSGLSKKYVYEISGNPWEKKLLKNFCWWS